MTITEQLAAALRGMPDDADMIENNPDEGARYFCCGNEVSFNVHPSRWPVGSIEGRTHSPDCWYVKARESLAAYDDATPTWTVFIVDDNGDHQTTFVTSGHGLRSNAIKAAMEECAEAWEQSVDSLRLLGVAEGEVRLVEWHD